MYFFCPLGPSQAKDGRIQGLGFVKGRPKRGKVNSTHVNLVTSRSQLFSLRVSTIADVCARGKHLFSRLQYPKHKFTKLNGLCPTFDETRILEKVHVGKETSVWSKISIIPSRLRPLMIQPMGHRRLTLQSFNSELRRTRIATFDHRRSLVRSSNFVASRPIVSALLRRFFVPN